MIRFVIIILFFLASISGSTQTSRFNRTYDLGDSETSSDILTHINGYDLVVGRYGNPFAQYFLRLNVDGDTLYSKKLEISNWVVGQGYGNSLIAINDTMFALCGFINDTSTSRPYLHMFNYTGDSIHQDTIYKTGALNALILKDSKFLSCGNLAEEGEMAQFLFCRYALDGTRIDCNVYGSQNYIENAYSISQCPDGGYILGGYRYDGSWDSNPYIVKTDSLGNFEWEREFVLTQWSEQAAHVQIDLDGNIYVFASKVSSKGSAWEYKRTWFTKLKSSGETIWEKTLSNVSITNSTYQVKIRRNKNFLVLVQSQPDNDSLGRIIGRIYEIDTSGSVLNNIVFEYDSTANPSGPNYPRSIDTTSDNGFIVAGFVSGNIPQDLWVVKFDSNGCYDTVFNNCLVGVEEPFRFDNFSLILYPNPASDVVNIDYTLPQGSTKAMLAVYGIDGRRVEYMPLIPREKTTQLNLSSFAPGIYFCNLTANGKVLTGQKFIVVK